MWYNGKFGPCLRQRPGPEQSILQFFSTLINVNAFHNPPDNKQCDNSNHSPGILSYNYFIFYNNYTIKIYNSQITRAPPCRNKKVGSINEPTNQRTNLRSIHAQIQRKSIQHFSSPFLSRCRSREFQPLQPSSQ